MEKGLHPQKQWISYFTQTGRLMDILEIVAQCISKTIKILNLVLGIVICQMKLVLPLPCILSVNGVKDHDVISYTRCNRLCES